MELLNANKWFAGANSCAILTNTPRSTLFRRRCSIASGTLQPYLAGG